jgi:hypothetical protein
MIKGQKVKLEFRGNKSPFIFIGGGATTLAFSPIDDRKKVILIIPDIKFKDGTSLEDTTRDSLVKAYAYNKVNPYLPTIRYMGREFVGGPELNTFCKVYEMPFYRGIRRSDKTQWLELKLLQKVRDDSYHMVHEDYWNKFKKKPSMTFLGNEAAKAALFLAKYKLNLLMYLALRTLYMFIDKKHLGITYEFNKSNVGIDEYSGHLVLRDATYDAEITTKIKKERRAEK